MADFTDLEKLKCVEREIALRRAVYSKRVAEKRMNHDTAEKEIGIMKAIREDYLIRMNGSH
jgi:hypothetical protein